VTASILEIEHADAISWLPAACAFRSYPNHDAGRLVGWDHGKLGGELALDDLEIGVAEASSLDADEQFMVSDVWDWLSLYLIWLVVLDLFHFSQGVFYSSRTGKGDQKPYFTEMGHLHGLRVDF